MMIQSLQLCRPAARRSRMRDLISNAVRSALSNQRWQTTTFFLITENFYLFMKVFWDCNLDFLAWKMRQSGSTTRFGLNKFLLLCFFGSCYQSIPFIIPFFLLFVVHIPFLTDGLHLCIYTWICGQEGEMIPWEKNCRLIVPRLHCLYQNVCSVLCL